MSTTIPAELYNQVTRLRLRVLRAHADALELEAVYPPGSPTPPDHFHPRQRERFEILSGEMMVRVAGVTTRRTAGDVFHTEPGVPHAMWNAADREATLLWTTSPALRTLELFTRLNQLAARGRTDASGKPALLDAAVVAREFRNELRLTTPPEPIQSIALAVLAPLGRLLGRGR